MILVVEENFKFGWVGVTAENPLMRAYEKLLTKKKLRVNRQFNKKVSQESGEFQKSGTNLDFGTAPRRDRENRSAEKIFQKRKVKKIHKLQ